MLTEIAISMKYKGITFYVTFWISHINSWFSASFNIRDRHCTQDSNQSKGKDMRIRKMPKRWLKGNSFAFERKEKHWVEESPHITQRKFYLHNICAKLFTQIKLKRYLGTVGSILCQVCQCLPHRLVVKLNENA